MKKLIMTAAVVACAAVVTAQTVTSANIVGYNKVDVVGGQLALVALNFDSSAPATLNDLIGTALPNLSKAYVWDKSTAGYLATAAYSTRSGAWSPNHAIDLGDAFWIESAAAPGVTNELIFSGEVALTVVSNSVPGSGVVATGIGFPVDIDFRSTVISTNLPANSLIYQWNGAGYDSKLKSARSGWGTTAIPVGVGEGFWLQNGGATEVIAAEPPPFTP